MFRVFADVVKNGVIKIAEAYLEKKKVLKNNQSLSSSAWTPDHSNIVLVHFPD